MGKVSNPYNLEFDNNNYKSSADISNQIIWQQTMNSSNFTDYMNQEINFYYSDYYNTISFSENRWDYYFDLTNELIRNQNNTIILKNIKDAIDDLQGIGGVTGGIIGSIIGARLGFVIYINNQVTEHIIFLQDSKDNTYTLKIN